jgi:hypothetical protein
VRARLAVVVCGQQPSQDGLQSERFEHPAGNILQVRFFGFPIRAIGQLRRTTGKRDQLGLLFHGGPHQPERGISPSVVDVRLAIRGEPEFLARDRVKPRGAGNGQRPQEHGIYQTECRGAGSHPQGQ